MLFNLITVGFLPTMHMPFIYNLFTHLTLEISKLKICVFYVLKSNFD